MRAILLPGELCCVILLTQAESRQQHKTRKKGRVFKTRRRSRSVRVANIGGLGATELPRRKVVWHQFERYVRQRSQRPKQLLAVRPRAHGKAG